MNKLAVASMVGTVLVMLVILAIFTVLLHLWYDWNVSIGRYPLKPGQITQICTADGPYDFLGVPMFNSHCIEPTPGGDNR